MKNRIFELKDSTATQVLVSRAEIEDEQNTVELSAWHTASDGEFYQYEIISFPYPDMADRYVADFTETSAYIFANSRPF